MKSNAGRKPKYDYATLEVGESCVCYWPAGHVGGVPDYRIYNALKQYEYSTGKKFINKGHPRGLHVLRVK